jgi:hypothetical protein
VDHQLTRRSAENCGLPLWYYADYPYAEEDAELADRLAGQGWLVRVFEITGQGFEAWYEAMAAYQSQVSTFWEDLRDLRRSLEHYTAQMNGVRLWQPPQVS